MRSLLRHVVAVCLLTILSIGFASAKVTAQTVHVSGGSTQGGIFEPLLFSWHYPLPVDGGGWASNESVTIVLHGPMNTLGVPATDHNIATLNADGTGAFNTQVQIPYDEGGAYSIIQPGLYQVVANGGVSGAAFATDKIVVSPATYKSDAVGIDWSTERGGRDDITGITHVFPHWMSVWDERPIAVYGTIADTDFDGNNQPAFVTHTDFPADHYAHDNNFMLVPDPDYRWAMGTSNFYRLAPDQAAREIRRMEIEIETQNAGDPDHTNQGVIGLPLFANPTAGDKVYVVGRWILDAGHPDIGDRSEIHPPRMLATIRQRPTVVPLTPGSTCMTYAKQVDVFVSGHGGGANRYFHVLSDVLGSGGRVRDVMADPSGYYSSALFSSTGLNVDPFASAGGYDRAPEFQNINDMDYDFDVQLPSPPSGALVPQVQVTKQALDGTSVNEVITYTNVVAGLPTVAHVHIPCNGGDNGIYARTLKFYWDKYKAPGRHFEVQMDNIYVKDNDDPFGIFETGEWFLWTDVCGQWINLSQLNPDPFFNTQDGDTIGGLGAGHFDVYLNPGDSMRVLTEGYEQDAFDYHFGQGFDNNSADDIAMLASTEADLSEPGDNDPLGGALIRIDNATKDNTPGSYDVASATTDGNYYQMRVRINYVAAPPRLELNGVPTDFGHVCLSDFEDKVVTIFNVGEAPLDVNSVAVTGDGFTRLTSPTFPLTIAGGEHVDITVRFSPTDIAQGSGQLIFDSNDPCQGHLTFPLSGTVDYPKMTLSGNLDYGMVPVDDRSIGFNPSKSFKINNTGACPLVVSSVSIATGGSFYSLGALPTFPQTIQPGGSLSVPVVFNPNIAGFCDGSVHVQAGNDPSNPNPLTISLGGTGIIPYAVATPANTIFDPTVVGFSRSQTITLANNGAAELIVDSINLAGGPNFTLSPASFPIRLAPNTSTNLTVTFAPTSVARRFDGSITVNSNDLAHPAVTDTFCGEGVKCGFRVLVKDPTGVPYNTVDQITLTSYGITPNTNTTLKNAPLVTINPPTSCVPIQYQMETMPLPPSTTSGKKGSQYTLKVKVGSKAQSISFTLAPNEFKIFTVNLH